jgi:hypothetical protein
MPSAWGSALLFRGLYSGVMRVKSDVSLHAEYGKQGSSNKNIKDKGKRDKFF